jgi:hypothetical protein
MCLYSVKSKCTSAKGLGGRQLIVYSKTFLARLCEQAERYDGKHLNHPVEFIMADDTVYRDGWLHEGTHSCASRRRTGQLTAT